MSEQKIVRMHVTSDRADELGLLHLISWQAEPLGSIQEFEGKKYRVIDNSAFNMVVTYEPIEEEQ